MPVYFWIQLNLLVMLGSISWGTFLGFLFVALLLYYGYVFWKYGLLREWLTGRRGTVAPPGVGGGDSPPGIMTDVGGAAAGVAAVGASIEVAARAAAPSVATVTPQAADMGASADEGSGTARGTPVYPVGKQMPLGLVEQTPGEMMDATGQPTDEAVIAGTNHGPGGAGGRVASINDTDAELFRIAETLIGQSQSLIREAAATQMARPALEQRLVGLLRANGRLVGTAYQASVESFIERSSRMQLRYVLSREDVQRLWGIGAAHGVGTADGTGPD